MQFIRAAVIVTAFFVVGFSVSARAADMPYEMIVPPAPTGLTDKVLVVEMFLYSCPHCYSFDPIVEAWRKKQPDYVQFVRVPAVYASSKDLFLNKAFYTAEALGILDTLHSAIFHAFHQKNQRFSTDKQLQDFFVSQGVPADDFRATYHSFGVDMRMRQARTLTSRYGIQSVPMMVINGKYRIESGKAGGYTKMMALIDELIEQERQAMGLGETPEAPLESTPAAAAGAPAAE
jgi:protein dithiol oxidoreductase (disulfide-forming)